MGVSTTHDGQAVTSGAEALLREHPDALVCGLAGNGLIVPVPQSVGLWGQGLIEGRALVDNVVAGDRSTVVKVWLRAQEEGAASDKVRLLRQPGTWTTLHFIDMREIHGVLLGVIIPSDEHAGEDTPAEEQAPAAPRFCWLTEDEGARVLDCDDAFTEMFGYTAAELIGESVLGQIHPEDQGRAVEGWLAVLSTGLDQQTRLRRRRKDGSYLWVDTTLRNLLNHPERNYVLVEIIDISAEMQAQEALAEREELLRRLTAAMPVGLLHVDTERNVVYNNARLLEILYGTHARVLSAAAEEPSGGPTGRAAPRAAAILSTLTDESMATFDAALERGAPRGRRPRRGGGHHAALRHLAARADEPAGAAAAQRRGQRRDHMRARHHRQRARSPGARAPGDVRPADPLLQPLIGAQHAGARARTRATPPAPASCTSTSTASSRSTTGSGTPPATSCWCSWPSA